jgi:hypothetical protein
MTKVAPRRAWSRSAGLLVLVSLVLVVVGCGVEGEQEDARTTTSRPRQRTTTEPATPRTTEPDTGAGVVAGIDLSALADLPEGEPPATWVEVSDDTGTLQVSVPGDWDETDERVGTVDGVDVPSVFAAPDLETFLDRYDVPGLKFLLYSHDLTGGDQRALLRQRRDQAELGTVCDGSETYPVDTGTYQGLAELWTGCTDDGGAYLVLVAGPDVADAAFDLVLEVQMISQADVAAARQAIETFRFVGSAEDIPVRPEQTTVPPTAAPTAPPTSAQDDTSGEDAAVALVTRHLQSCGMGWDWTSVNSEGPGLWNVEIWIMPPAGPENGDPGAGMYFVDTDLGEVTSTNGTANVLCPG